MSVFYKTQTVPITKQDVEKFAELSEEEKALIGQVYIDKAMFNAECTRRLKDAKKKLDEYATIIKSEEHEVPCRVEIDLHDNKARIYREDTGDYVRSRPIEDDERQATMFAPPAPVKNIASEAAKAKSPGLNDAPEEPPAPAPPVSVPDEVRAAVVEAGVSDSMIDAAIRAIRDGGDPERVIANAKRAVKGEKPAKEKKSSKPKKKSKPLGMDEFDPKTSDEAEWSADLEAAQLTTLERETLLGSILSRRGMHRVLRRVIAGATVSQSIEAETEVAIDHGISLLGEKKWELAVDEFGLKDAFYFLGKIERGETYAAALKVMRETVRGTADDDTSSEDDEQDEDA